MFETLTKGFRAARQRLQGLTELTEDNLDQALRDVRMSLLEADVDLSVTKRFLAAVKEKALGEVVRTSIDVQGKKLKVGPADVFIKICQDELVAMMSFEGEPITYAAKPALTGIMMVGLQGAGKTTTAAKLAKLVQNEGRRPMLVAADLQRPGAVEQLKVLGARVGAPVFSLEGADPVTVCEQGRREAIRQKCDVVIYDTAGRLAIDEALMEELAKVKRSTSPENVLLVVDAMIGQDAVKTAAGFNERLGLTGVVLTKLDGDARGGAALSIKEVTGASVKLAGMGEALDKLEPFRPEGMATRVLGFGDVVGLMKDFEGVVDKDKAERDAQRMLQGRFTLNDFLDQLRAIKQMGPIKDIFEKLPFFADGMPEGMNLDDGELVKAEAIVSSMTRDERIDIALFRQAPNRVRRVARGSGRSDQEVAELLERFGFMQKMMGGLGQSAGLLSRIPGMKQLAMARQMKNAVKLGGLEGNPMMGGLANELLEGLVGGGMGGIGDLGGLEQLFGAAGGKGQPGPRKTFDKQQKKKLRKMQKKSRKKGR